MRSRLGDNSRQKLSEIHQQRLILSAKQYTSGLLEKNGFFFCSSSGVMMQSNITRLHISEKAQRWFLSNSAFPMREKHFSAYWFIYMQSSTHKNCMYMDSSFPSLTIQVYKQDQKLQSDWNDHTFFFFMMNFLYNSSEDNLFFIVWIENSFTPSNFLGVWAPYEHRIWLRYFSSPQPLH